jgi:hypothetical protein
MAEQTRSAPLTNGESGKPDNADIIIDIDIDELPNDGNVDNDNANKGGAEKNGDDADDKLLFAKSTNVRRRIEEKLEVRLLKDELGIDDIDL